MIPEQLFCVLSHFDSPSPSLMLASPLTYVVYLCLYIVKVQLSRTNNGNNEAELAMDCKLSSYSGYIAFMFVCYVPPTHAHFYRIVVKLLTFAMGSNFEITFVLEKHVVEDDVLFTNRLVGK